MRFLAILVGLACFSVQVSANETRLNTLREPLGVRDEAQTFFYPAMVNEYSLAMIELGTKGYSEVYGGAITNLGGSSAGIIVSRDASLMTSARSTSLSLVDEFLVRSASNELTNAGQAILPVPERPVEFLYGMGNKEKGWGLRLTTATYRQVNKDTAADTKAEAKAEQLDLFFGYSIFGPGRLDLGLGLGVLGTLEKKSGGANETKYEYARGNQLTFSGRKFLRQGKGRIFLGGSGLIRSPKLEVKVAGTEEDKKFDEKTLQLEAGYLAVPTTGVLINLGTEVGMFESQGPSVNAGTGIGSGGGPATPSILSSGEIVKRSSHWIATSIGVEAPVYASLGILGGMSYAVFGSRKENNEITEVETEQSITQTADSGLWSLGLFVEEGSLRADASLAKSFLHDGPHFVAGNATAPLLGQISMTYKI